MVSSNFLGSYFLAMICIFYCEKLVAYLGLYFLGALQKNEEKGELDLEGTVCLILHRKTFSNIMLLIFISVFVLNALLNKAVD